MVEAITTAILKKGRTGRTRASSTARSHPPEECAARGRFMGLGQYGRFATLVFVISVPLLVSVGIAAEPDRNRTYVVSPETARAMEEAAPGAPRTRFLGRTSIHEVQWCRRID